MFRPLFYIALAIFLLPPPGHAQDAPVAKLEPGDLIRVEIWREKDLSGHFPVDESGMVTLPLLGDKRLGGMPIERVRDLLVEEYRVYLQNPSISITPLRRIYVLGEVTKPGLYVVDLTVSLAGAVALASGVTEDGDMQKIRVLRGGQVLHQRVGPSETVQGVDLRSGDEIFVERRSWLQRNSVALTTALISVASSIIVTLILSADSSSSDAASSAAF